MVSTVLAFLSAAFAAASVSAAPVIGDPSAGVVVQEPEDLLQPHRPSRIAPLYFLNRFGDKNWSELGRIGIPHNALSFGQQDAFYLTNGRLTVDMTYSAGDFPGGQAGQQAWTSLDQYDHAPLVLSQLYPGGEGSFGLWNDTLLAVNGNPIGWHLCMNNYTGEQTVVINVTAQEDDGCVAYNIMALDKPQQP
ncbi:hypothetical protein H2203_000736 [Taxawa tesnikishii (nom. ined.)]|nr:hypothetical protein H2203_000736 [Dothideales sp. JES 119]